MLNCKTSSQSFTNNIADWLTASIACRSRSSIFFYEVKFVVITLMSSHNSASQQNYNFRYITFISQSSNLATWRRAVVLYPLAHSIQRDLFVPRLNNLQTSCGWIFFLPEPHHWVILHQGIRLCCYTVFPCVRRCYIALNCFECLPESLALVYYATIILPRHKLR